MEKRKHDPSICRLRETHFRLKDPQTKSEGMAKDIPCKQKQKESGSNNTHETKETLKQRM